MSWTEVPDELYDRLETLGESLIALHGWKGLYVDWDSEE